MNEISPPRERLFTFKSGGWAIVLGVFLGLCIVLWRVIVTVNDPSGQPRGDGRTVESYQFDLSNLRVPRAKIVAGARYKNYIRALTAPEHMLASSVPTINRAFRKFLVDKDRVISITLNGETCGYPLRFVRWHEVINDTLGGIPIAVTYHYLCDSAMVFDRRLAGETIEFGVSGLLLNSNLLLYDRQPGQTGESLWSQMTGEAVAGPAAAANRRLTRIAHEVLPFREYAASHPKDTVMKPPGRYVLKKLYLHTPAPAYFSHDTLKFPVDPLPPVGDGRLRLKEPVVAVTIDGATVVYPLSRLEARADERGVFTTEQAGVPLTFTCYRGAKSARVEAKAEGRNCEVNHCAWFCWHAFHPTDPVFGDA